MPPSLPPRFSWSWQDSAPMRWVRQRFGYSRSEARGMVLLLALMVGTGLLPGLLHPAAPTYLPAPDQAGLDKLVAGLQEHRTAAPAYASRYPARSSGALARGARYPAVPQVRLAPFDPNALTARDWEARGVPHFVAARLVKYREAAAGFKTKAQIRKMYGLEDSVYQRLAPFMQLPDEAPQRAGYSAGKPGADGKFPPFTRPGEAPTKFPRKPRNLQPFDLNTADTTQLMQIRGIGAGRAKWVVKYRNQLGGYLREEQLDEVFVLRDAPDLRDSLKKYTFVAPDFGPQLVNVNAASFDELYPHPYIRKGLARLIVAYRSQHGPFKTVEDLKKIPVLKTEDWEKMRPYLRCD